MLCKRLAAVVVTEQERFSGIVSNDRDALYKVAQWKKCPNQSSALINPHCQRCTNIHWKSWQLITFFSSYKILNSSVELDLHQPAKMSARTHWYKLNYFNANKH